LGVNTYRNCGIIIDFHGEASVLDSENALYYVGWKKSYVRFKNDYVFFPPEKNYQTIAARNHLLLPLWIECDTSKDFKATILFHCETRNGEAAKDLVLKVKQTINS
jgi:hypothetical protein